MTPDLFLRIRQILFVCTPFRSKVISWLTETMYAGSTLRRFCSASNRVSPIPRMLSSASNPKSRAWTPLRPQDSRALLHHRRILTHRLPPPRVPPGQGRTTVRICCLGKRRSSFTTSSPNGLSISMGIASSRRIRWACSLLRVLGWTSARRIQAKICNDENASGNLGFLRARYSSIALGRMVHFDRFVRLSFSACNRLRIVVVSSSARPDLALTVDAADGVDAGERGTVHTAGLLAATAAALEIGLEAAQI